MKKIYNVINPDGTEFRMFLEGDAVVVRVTKRDLECNRRPERLEVRMSPRDARRMATKIVGMEKLWPEKLLRKEAVG